ncbi:uncharacterized protein proca1 [Menidia menidia]
MWSVFFVFLSYLDRNVVKGDFLSRALDAEKESREMLSVINGTFCATMSIIGDSLLYQVSDGAEVVRTVVSPAGKVVNCSIIVNQMEVKSFVHQCRLGLKEQAVRQQLDTRFTRMDEAKLMCREFKERSERFSGRIGTGGDDKVLQRSKRGFTYPGTLWCGAGNMADRYDQLGEFADTDSCCRTHDHCPHVIHAFSSNYGHTNFKWHSVCHCDCDNALKDCLRNVNDTSSRVVGQAFFNVIGVPCFDFVYEEQCAERHWYGLCKRYERLPIAMLREAVPYDFGGIDVIDELPIAPPEDSKKSNEDERPESATQSTVSGPEEPSLRNVVTAAEDFIKVLATVSTSQSSAADSDKDEAQSSEKKKRKNTGKKKKTSKKPKGKGKGRKRKQKAETGAKAEEGGPVSAPGSRAEEVLALSNFLSESNRHQRPGINTNRVDDGGYEQRAKDEPSNALMRDEPAEDKATAELREEIPASTGSVALIKHKAKPRGQRKGRRKKSNKTGSSVNIAVTTSENLSLVPVPTIIDAPQQPGFTEHRLSVSTPRAPTVVPRAQRVPSKERGDRKGGKKRRKAISTTSNVSVPHQNSSMDVLNVPHLTAFTHPPLTDPPTPPLPTTAPHLPRGPDVPRGGAQVTALSSTLSALKRRSKDRAQRNRRRKTTALPPGEKQLFSHGRSENRPPGFTAPDPRAGPNGHASNAATRGAEIPNEWRLFTTASPTVSTKVPRPPATQRRKKKKQTDPVTLETSTLRVATAGMKGSERPWMITSTAPAMSPLQFSIAKAEAQFSRKKRRKALLSNRQQ